MKAAFLGSIVLAAVFGLASVDCGCGDVGCAGGLTVEVAGTWSEGQYDVEVDMDGHLESCTVDVPDNGGENISCTGAVYSDLFEREKMNISIPSEAEAVKIRIKRNGSEIFARDFEPKYEEFEPNGAFCGGACRSAKETFSL